MARGPRRNPGGPLRWSLLRQINECRWWDKTRPPEIEPQDDDYDYRVKRDDNYDVLALVALRDGAMGHLIMHRNDSDDQPCRLWPNDFVPGRVLQIPTRTSLERRRII